MLEYFTGSLELCVNLAMQQTMIETMEESESQVAMSRASLGDDSTGLPISCTTCQKYREDPWPPPDSVTYYWDFEWDELSLASGNGCPICSELLSAVSNVLTDPVTKFTVMASESRGLLLTVPQKSHY